MTDSDRLARIERQLDAVAADVVEIKLHLAEAKGAHKAVYVIASGLGAVAGLATRLLWRVHT